MHTSIGASSCTGDFFLSSCQTLQPEQQSDVARPNMHSSPSGEEQSFDEQSRGNIGTLHFDHGGVYQGNILNSKPHGLGRVVWPKHDKDKHAAEYDGQWSNGMRHGVGRLLLRCGTSYEGWWSFNLKQGRGVGVYPTDQGVMTYVGDHVEGREEGDGSMVLISSEGNSRVEYKGKWKDGDLVEGKIVGRNNSSSYTYEGECRNGCPHGMGTIDWTWPDTRAGISYKGGFKDAEPHGSGTLTAKTDSARVRIFIMTRVHADDDWKVTGNFRFGKYKKDLKQEMTCREGDNLPRELGYQISADLDFEMQNLKGGYRALALEYDHKNKEDVCASFTLADWRWLEDYRNLLLMFARLFACIVATDPRMEKDLFSNFLFEVLPLQNPKDATRFLVLLSFYTAKDFKTLWPDGRSDFSEPELSGDEIVIKLMKFICKSSSEPYRHFWRSVILELMSPAMHGWRLEGHWVVDREEVTEVLSVQRDTACDFWFAAKSLYDSRAEWSDEDEWDCDVETFFLAARKAVARLRFQSVVQRVIVLNNVIAAWMESSAKWAYSPTSPLQQFINSIACGDVELIELHRSKYESDIVQRLLCLHLSAVQIADIKKRAAAEVSAHVKDLSL